MVLRIIRIHHFKLLQYKVKFSLILFRKSINYISNVLFIVNYICIFMNKQKSLFSHSRRRPNFK